LEASWAGRLLLIGYKWSSLRTLYGWLKSQRGSRLLHITMQYTDYRSYDFGEAYTIGGGNYELKNVSHSILKESWVGRILLIEWNNLGRIVYVEYLWKDLLTCG
jgi:hypothetical protein